jgi:hemoglobin-like flavoprotein
MTEYTVIDVDKVKLVEDSFKNLYSEQFVQGFYTKLFAAHPEFKPLFSPDNQDEQEAKLFKALMLASQTLRKPGAFKSSFKALGGRHTSGYRVKPEYYSAFVAVLLDTLREFAGSTWNPELEAAWSEALSRLVEAMTEAS